MITKTGSHTKEWLKEMQSLPLQQKIILSESRIREALSACRGRCYVAFSGGKDSGVLLHLVAQVWKTYRPNEPLHAIFTDTGNEYISIVKFVPEYCKFIEDNIGIKIELHTPKPVLYDKPVTFIDVCKRIGYPIASKKISKQTEKIRNNFKSLGYTKKQAKSIINSLDTLTDIEAADYLRSIGLSKTSVLGLTGVNSKGKQTIGWKISNRWKPLIYAPFKCSDKCCEILKKHPANRCAKQLKLTLSFIGELADDGLNREKAYLQTGCNAFDDSGIGKSKPLGFWTEQDILEYYEYYDIPHCSIYGQLNRSEDGSLKFSNYSRTGCKLCLFGIQFDRDRLNQLYTDEPNTVNYAMKSKENNGLGYDKVIDYIENNCGLSLILPNKYRKKEDSYE